jgi:hypothetical protein
VTTLFVFLVGILVGLLLSYLLLRKRLSRPTRAIPDRLRESEIARELSVRLAGAMADGSQPPAPGGPPARVVWVDAGDEVLVHLDSVKTRVRGRSLLVSVDLETDQTGRSPLVVAFAIGARGEQAGLFAVTDEVPHGHPALAARWGAVLQDAIWSGLLAVAKDHAAERGQWPAGIFTENGGLHLVAGLAIAVTEEPVR